MKLNANLSLEYFPAQSVFTIYDITHVPLRNSRLYPEGKIRKHCFLTEVNNYMNQRFFKYVFLTVRLQ